MTIRNLLSSFLTLFIIAFALPCAAQTKAESIDELLTQYKEYGKFNGSILVAEEGKIIFKKGYGFANLEWDIPNDVDTKFRIASISKQFTAMLIVQLAAENKLDLHAPISTYLPHYHNQMAMQLQFITCLRIRLAFQNLMLLWITTQ